MSFQLLSRHGANRTREPRRARIRTTTRCSPRGPAARSPRPRPASSTRAGGGAPSASCSRSSWPLVAVWLLVKAVEDPRRFAVVTLNGTTLAALYFVVASGFTLIFGLMRVVNMAHGSLYLLGGYLALEMQDAWFKEEGGSGLGLSLSGDDRRDLLAASAGSSRCSSRRRSSA